MKIKYLRQYMISPKKEYIINKHVNIKGLDVLLLSFTIEEGKNRLWLIYEDKEIHTDFAEPEFLEDTGCQCGEDFMTNRQEFLRNIEKSKNSKHLFIKEMEIQGHTVRFDSSSGSRIYYTNWEAMMKLNHFIDKELIPEKWNEMEISDLVIYEYKQMEGEAAPDIDESKELSIEVHIDRSSQEIAIEKPFKVKFGKQSVGTRIPYYDPILERENYVFIDEVYSFDPYEDILDKSQKMEDPQMREDMIKHLNEALENLCPRGKNLAIIRYENEDNTQLRFMMKDFLDAKRPVYRSGSSAIGFIGGSNDMGINGYKPRECIMQPIDKDFDGELEIELFSRYEEIPEEIVRI